MPSLPEQALKYALDHSLNLTVYLAEIPTSPFIFKCLTPRPALLADFNKAMRAHQPWPSGMPLPVVTYRDDQHEWEIMDGMNRICAAKMEGFREVPALVASGETHDKLYRAILKNGYFGEDFVEMLAMVSPEVLTNLKLRNKTQMSGK